MNPKQQDKPDMDFSKKKLDKIFNYATDLIQGKPLYKLEGIPKGTMDAMYAVAMDCYSSGRYDDAASLFGVLCLYDHTNAYHFLGLGSCMQMLNRIPQACIAYNTVISLNPYSCNAHFNLAQCLIKAGKTDEAIISLKNVIFVAKKKLDIQKKDIYKKAVQMLEVLTSAA